MQLAAAGWDSSCCVGRAIYVYDSCLCACGWDFVMQLGVAGGDSNCCVGRAIYVYDSCLSNCCVWRAIYVYDTCLCVCGRDFLMQLAMEGGDSNSNCCVGGAILGLRTGYQRLPTDWIQGLRAKQLSWLNFRINHLLDMMGLPWTVKSDRFFRPHLLPVRHGSDWWSNRDSSDRSSSLSSSPSSASVSDSWRGHHCPGCWGIRPGSSP